MLYSLSRIFRERKWNYFRDCDGDRLKKKKIIWDLSCEMPFEIMDPRGISTSSDFFHDIGFPTERQVGFWKQKIMPDHHGIDGMGRAPGTKSVSSSPLEKLLPLGAQSVEYLKVQQSLVARDQKAKPQAGGEERTASLSQTSWRFMEQNPSTVSTINVQPTSFWVNGNGAEIGRIHHESSLFSSSLSDAYSRKLRLSANDVLFIQSVDTAVPDYEQDKPIESLKEIEAQTIGNLLPDEDDLFSGVTDELGFTTDPISGGNLDDFDIFCSGGGMELDGGNLSRAVQRSSASIGGISGGQGSLNGLIVSQHPNAELPSRTLFVRNINSNVEDYELKLIFEQYGDIRTLYTASKHRGFVMISYYDIRAAQNAMGALQNKPLRSRKLDIHYSIPKDNPSEQEINQGTLMVFNLDYSISNDDIRKIFGVHGEIKEIREVPQERYHKFVEYYDVRAAEAALRALNRFSEGVVKSSSMKSGSIQEPHSAIHIQEFIENRFSQGNCSVPNTFPSRLRVACASNQYAIDESCHSQNQINFGLAGTIGTQIAEGNGNMHVRELGSSGHPRELSGGGSGSLGKKSCPLHGHPNRLNNSNAYQYHPSSPMKWQNLPSLINGVQAHHQPQLHGYPNAPVNMMNAASAMQNYHVESSRAVNPSIWDRRIAYTHEAPGFHLGSLESAGFPCISPLNSLENASQNIFSLVGGNCIDLSANAGMCSPQQMCHIFPGRNPVMSVPTSFESPNERVRFRRKDINSNHADRKQFELDIDRILHVEDSRTTLMLKNIPNKYTSKMLLASIDEHHQGTYDFIYLPIDFKNKCNVGYAFINMIDPLQIVPFHKTFHGRKWEKFNSEKVASLAYARIQGKAALVTHFQNSSLMNEDKRCRPILFRTDGPNAGDQEPFPMGTNIRSRYGRTQAFGSDEKHQQGSPSTSANGEESSNETDSSGSGKD